MNNRRHDDHLPSRRLMRWAQNNSTWLADALFYVTFASGLTLIAWWRYA